MSWGMRSTRLVLASLLALAACDPDEPPPEQPCTGPGERSVRLSTRLTSQYLGGKPANVAWVAFQDGNCPWKRVEGVDGAYVHTITHPHYGVAVACDEAEGDVGLRMIFATVDELTQLEAVCAR